MGNTKADGPIPAHVMAELQAAADSVARDIHDPQKMLQACERMDRLRDEIRRQHGILDIGVSAIRELRDGA
jgi:hypothetical protein